MLNQCVLFTEWTMQIDSIYILEGMSVRQYDLSQCRVYIVLKRAPSWLSDKLLVNIFPG